MTNHNPSGGARTFVLAGPVLALHFTVFSLATGTGIGLLVAVWFGAALWSFLTALVLVLWRGFHGRDWSAFSRHELPEGRGERFDWSTRTGRYAWRRDFEDGHLSAHEGPGGHCPNTPFP